MILLKIAAVIISILAFFLGIAYWAINSAEKDYNNYISQFKDRSDWPSGKTEQQ